MSDLLLEGRRDTLRSVLMRDFTLHLFTAWHAGGITEVKGSGYAAQTLTLADWVFEPDGLAANCIGKEVKFDAPLKLKVMGYYLTRPGSEIVIQAERFPEPVDIFRSGESIEIENIPISVRPKKEE